MKRLIAGMLIALALGSGCISSTSRVSTRGAGESMATVFAVVTIVIVASLVCTRCGSYQQ